MTEKPQHFDPLDPAFAERRAAARKRLELHRSRQDAGRCGKKHPCRRDWFEAVYALAEGDPAQVPWGNLSAHPLLADWLAQNPRLDGQTALDIGCGLGDNAAALAGQGASVTAFDLVFRATEWARSRFPDKGIAFRAADLFDPPPEWRGAFDFVHETYTLQALPAAIFDSAREAIASFVKPGGKLLVIARARDEAQDFAGPPWPLARRDIEAFGDYGLEIATLEDIPPDSARNRHWRALLRKSLA